VCDPRPFQQAKELQMIDKPTNSLGMHKADLDKPAVASVAGYKQNQAPATATYGKGVALGDLAGIERAAEARRQHGADILNRPTGARGPHGKDSDVK
jgi:hypothetical protein